MLLVSSVLAVGAFWYNEKVVPVANLKAYSLLWDVRQQKLALDIRENVFYTGIPGYTIKVNKKLGENGDILKGVMIYDHNGGTGNSRMILADSGRMFTRFGGQYLALELFRGRSYAENPNDRNRAGASFLRQGFDRTLITFSLASFSLDRTKEELFNDNKMMKNIPQLIAYSDSLHNRLGLERRLLITQLNPYYTYAALRHHGPGRQPAGGYLESVAGPPAYPNAQHCRAGRSTAPATCGPSSAATWSASPRWPRVRAAFALRFTANTRSQRPFCSCF